MSRQADIRRFLFANAQAALSPAELETQRQQNEAAAISPLTTITKKEHETSKRWFVEFMKDQHPTVDVELEYFSPGAPLPNVVVLKEYARYIARSRRGAISEKLSLNTVQQYMSMIMSLIQRACGHRSMQHTREEVDNFVRSNLANQEDLSTAMHIKAVAHTVDLSFIISKLYEPEYLNSFENMRMVLNLTLYMALMVDTCGRGGEIARNYHHDEHMCIRWQDVEFYSFQSSEKNDFDIRANVKINWQKNQTQNESAYKTIPLPGLLPATHALEDSLRLLLNLAILDGILSDVDEWNDLLKLRVSPTVAKTGRRIRMNTDKQGLPVLRRMKNHTLTADPVQTVDIHPKLAHLGKHCGLQNRLTGYAIRRGVAHILADKTNDQNRMFLMGHTDRSSFAPYQSRISTIDFPAMFRGVEERSVLPQSGILLNRSDDAPIRLSEAGKTAVMQNEEVVKATKLQEQARQNVLQKFKSVNAAKNANDPLWVAFDAAEYALRNLLAREEKKAFKTEYKKHFETLYVDEVAVADHGGHGGGDPPVTTVHQLALEANEQISSIFNDPSTGINDENENPWLEKSQSTVSIGISNNGGVPQSSTIVQTVVKTDLSSGPVQHDGPDRSTSSSKTTTALHGNAVSFMGKGKARANKLVGTSTYNDMTKAIERCEGRDDEISSTMILWYSVSHAIGQFYPGQEPFPGTYDCRFCGQDLRSTHHADEHCYSCAKKNALEMAAEIRNQRFPLNRPCSYKFCGHGANLGKFVSCGATFNDMVTQGEHMRCHVRSMQKTGDNVRKVPTCFFESCAKNPKGGRDRDGPDFASTDELLAHVWSEHNICTLKAIEAYFCVFCDTWLLEPMEWRTHAERHLEQAQQIVTAVGYTGMANGRLVLPRLCPFCFHGEDLPTHQRIFPFYTMFELSKHITTHIDRVKTAAM